MIRQLLTIILKDKAKAAYYHNLKSSFLQIRLAFFTNILKKLEKLITLIPLSSASLPRTVRMESSRLYSTKFRPPITSVLSSEIQPHEGNTLRLKKKNWKCLWMDAGGDGEMIKKELITAENINHLFRKYNVPMNFDLLSIDIDSNDYWIWKAIETTTLV